MRRLPSLFLPLILCLGAFGQELVAEPGQVTETRGTTVKVYKTGTKNAVAYAAMLSQPGDVIGIRGKHDQFKLGSGTGSGKDEAVRSQGFDDIAFEGLDPSASIRGVVYGRSCPIGDVAVRRILVDCMQQVGVMVEAGTLVNGTLELSGITFKSYPSVTKWVIRGHGSAGWLVEDCVALDGAQEHFMYVDSAQGCVVRACVARWMKRTMFQHVERNYPETVGATYPWRMAKGEILVEDCEAIDCGQNGGSSFTMAGARDCDVVFSRLRVTDVVGSTAGAIVCYYEGKGGSWALPDGLNACKSFTLIGSAELDLTGGPLTTDVSDRDVVFISQTREAHIYPYNAYSDNRAALHLEHNGKPNGTVAFHGREPPSKWDWSGAGYPRKNGQKLTPAELDAMYVQP